MGLLLAIEFILATGAFEGGDGMQDKANAQTDKASKAMAGGGDDDGNPMKKVIRLVAQKFMATIGKYVVKFFMKFLMAPMRWIANTKAIEEQRVPNVYFKGLGQ